MRVRTYVANKNQVNVLSWIVLSDQISISFSLETFLLFLLSLSGLLSVITIVVSGSSFLSSWLSGFLFDDGVSSLFPILCFSRCWGRCRGWYNGFLCVLCWRPCNGLGSGLSSWYSWFEKRELECGE